MQLGSVCDRDGKTERVNSLSIWLGRMRFSAHQPIVGLPPNPPTCRTRDTIGWIGQPAYYISLFKIIVISYNI